MEPSVRVGSGGARRAVPGAALLLGLGLSLSVGCSVGGDGPVAEPNDGYLPPVRTTENGIERIENRGAAERLLVHTAPQGDVATLLFLESRAAQPTREGGTAWADLDGGRVIFFDPEGRVSGIVQAEGVVPPPEPVAVQAGPEGLRIFGRTGSQWVVSEKGLLRPRARSLPAPVSGADLERVAMSRSLLHAPAGPVRDDDPLVWVGSGGDDLPRGLGRARRPAEPLLGHLVNTGWALPHEDGGAYFAPALRPELIRLDSRGEVLWFSTRPPARPVREPRFEAVGGQARADFEIVQLAVARGPDGRIYLLAVGPDGVVSDTDRLLVFDEDGVLLREGEVPAGHALFADRRGAVHALPPEVALSDPSIRERSPFRGFDLPDLMGEGRVRLEDYQGKVVLVNFWASWCPPCREEIPALDRFAADMDSADVVVIGLNEDRIPAQGSDFLAELGGVSYPNAAGGGDLRREYGYRGLPYTVLLDREHRVVRSFYGFGGSLEGVRELVLQEIARDAEPTLYGR